MADDLGYTDLGAYGSEIETPHLDSLAKTGIAFSQFHTAPMCAVTRSMLLSGTDNHIAGMGSQSLETDEFGYEGHLSDRVAPLPELLKAAGYHTAMAGKWHLGFTSDQDPVRKGFEHAYVLLEGGANHYSNAGIFPEFPQSPYTEEGEKTIWPEGEYSTDYYTDKLIEYLEGFRSDDQPFFLYAAYTSPHWPLQVDSIYSNKYKGKYDDGYEVLRQRRFDRLKILGIIPEVETLPKVHPNVKPWNSLSPDEQKKESRKMEIYAGMVDNLDQNIGRLFQYLRNTHQLENTLVIFLSDNGAAGEDLYHTETYGPFLLAHFTEDFADMGTARSFISYGPPWAEACSAPFRYFKGYTTEGGITTPMIISGPGVERHGVSNAFVTVKDIAPTLYSYSGVIYPLIYHDKRLFPLEGQSMVPFLQGQGSTVHDTPSFIIEHRGRIGVRAGDWKLVNSDVPYDVNNFSLYNLALDPGEQFDLKETFVSEYSGMLAMWEKYRRYVRIQLPTPTPLTRDQK